MGCCTSREDDESPPFCEMMVAYAGDNALQVNESKAETRLREEFPTLLLDDEKVVMAFKGRGGAGRDGFFFTSSRVVVIDVRGISGNSVSYMSIPYDTIQAYSVETAASMLDTDSTLRIWSNGVGCTSMDFMKAVDIVAIGRHFDALVLVEGKVGANVQDGAQATMDVPHPDSDSKVGKFVDWLGNNARQMDAKEIEKHLKEELNILMNDETVEMAFKCGRDSFILTSKRLLDIDVKGITGTAVEYKTVLWSSLRAFSIQTAGSFFDIDCELTIFTNIESMPRIEQDLRNGKCDVMAIQKFFTDKLLGTDTVAASKYTTAGQRDSGPDFWAWMGNDSRMIDATSVNSQFHSNPPILQGSEQVEMAFKGRRDLTLFTTKRLLIVDLTGWTGQRVNYISIPWQTIQAFGVRSAGTWFDKDSEMLIWTDISDVFYPPKEKEDDPPPPPIPRNSYIELDFQKDKVDLMMVHRYLSERCVPLAKGGYLPPEVAVSSSVLRASPEKGVESFLSWVGDDMRAIDPVEMDRQLHDVNPMLQTDERVVMAFKVGRDMMVCTTKRLLLVDVQGWTGNKIEWVSVPYTSLRAFSVESAGSWDRDATVALYCKIYWIGGSPGNVIVQDLRKGKVDIIAIQSFVAAQLIGAEDGSSTTVPKLVEGAPADAPGGIDGFLSWVGDDAAEIDAETVNQKLHDSPPILQSDEKAELCLKAGRDMFILTTKRVLFVDVKGWTGKKVNYMSFPLKHCGAFEVKSGGMINFFDSARAAVYTDVPGATQVGQDLHKDADIWSIQEFLAKKLLRS
mmetsp:Transcript_46043/g.85918  ORF Transcript_46043/g.85918 Transcript_46043/m.85918 type:complete len:793 (+) Transcript_46043:51-2429(+)